MFGFAALDFWKGQFKIFLLNPSTCPVWLLELLLKSLKLTVAILLLTRHFCEDVYSCVVPVVLLLDGFFECFMAVVACECAFIRVKAVFETVAVARTCHVLVVINWYCS